MTTGKQFLQPCKLLAPSFKKHVICIIDQSAQHMAGFGGRFRIRNHCGIAREPDESSLRQQTSRPPAAFMSRETGDGALMKRMMRPGEGQQDVCVQHKRFHSSSQARRMALSEIMGVPRRTSKV